MGMQGEPGRLFGIQGGSVDCLGCLPALKQQELQDPGLACCLEGCSATHLSLASFWLSLHSPSSNF